MIRMVIDVETSDIIGTKEIIAMALEKLGEARIIQCIDLDEQGDFIN